MALALDGQSELIDPYGGVEDLRAGVLRVLHDGSFSDDPTRALRGARYAARLGLALEPGTERLLREADLETVSSDRVAAELAHIAGEPTPSAALALVDEWGLIDLGKGPKLAAAIEHLYDARPGWAEFADRDVAILLAVAPGDHPARLRGRAGKIAHHAAPGSPAEIQVLAHDHVPEVLAMARAAGASWLDLYVDSLRHVELEIDGYDLIAAGAPEGPAVGVGLNAALAAKLDGSVHEPRRRAAHRLGCRRGGLSLGPMDWKEQDGVRWLEAELPGARAAFTTRVEGLSEAPYDSLNVAVKTGDEPGRVHDNRRTLAAALGIAPENVVMGRQVHGADLHWHSGPQAPRVYADVLVSPIEVDGHLTDQPGLVPFVMTADCLPIALAGPGGVASVHGGWRGLAAGIAGRAAERIGASAAAIGPGHRPVLLRGRRRGAGAVLGPRRSRRGPHARPARGRPAPARASRRRRHRDRGYVHVLQPRALLLAPPRRRAHRPPGRARLAGELVPVVEQFSGLDPDRLRSNLESVREHAGAEVEVLAATKYVPVDEMGALAEAGLTLVGENRQQDLEAKHERWGDRFDWDFIGNLQSRKVKRIVPLVRLIHSLASDSALAQLERARGARDGGAGRGQPRRRGEQGWGGAGRARRVHRALPGQRRRADDDAAVRRRPRGVAALFRAPGRARRRARPRPPFDGNDPGLARRGGGGCDDHQTGVNPLSLNYPYRSRNKRWKAESEAHMGMKDTWRRSLEYFGLVEGDYIEEGEYVEDGTDPEMSLDQPREAAPVSSMRGRRGGRDDADDLFADDEPPRRSRLRPVDDSGRGRSRGSEPVRVGNGGSDFSMHVVTPRNFNDAQQVADEFKRRKPVIINLQNSDRELSKRLIDFASGMTYALGGGMQRISQGIFLLTPENVQVSAEEKARMLEGGFFNQS